MNKSDVSLGNGNDNKLSCFQVVFNRLFIKLLNFSSGYIYDREEAQDIVQDVFLKLWEDTNYDIEELVASDKINALLFTMTRNKCLDVLKHKKVELKYKQGRQDEYLRNSINTHGLSADSSINLLIGKDIERAISKALSELPEPIRTTFILNRFQNLTYKEIASKFDISEKTVEYRISNALKELRVKLSPYSYMLLALYLADTSSPALQELVENLLKH